MDTGPPPVSHRPPASRDVFSDVGAFATLRLVMDEVRTEHAALAADGTRSGPKPALAGAASSKSPRGRRGGDRGNDEPLGNIPR